MKDRRVAVQIGIGGDEHVPAGLKGDLLVAVDLPRQEDLNGAADQLGKLNATAGQFALGPGRVDTGVQFDLVGREHRAGNLDVVDSVEKHAIWQADATNDTAGDEDLVAQEVNEVGAVNQASAGDDDIPR